MSTATVSSAAGGFDDFDRLEFDLIVADFDEPARSHPSRAAQRREGQDEIRRGLGLRRHRSREREA